MAPPAKNEKPADIVDDDVEASDEEPSENKLTDVVLAKYQAAGEIANKALAAVLAAAVDGASVLQLCSLGDAKIGELAKAAYAKDKKLRKGIAFPTCVSPATALCSLSPLPSDPEAGITLKTGDVVRVELGAHIDGYIAQAAHTMVVGASKAAPATGRTADVLQAAHVAAEAVIRLLRPSKTIGDIVDMVDRVAADFECTPVENVVASQVLRNILDGPKQIIFNSSEPLRRDIRETAIEEGEVYAVNLLLTTGEGKTKPGDARTTVFKRNADHTYQLKLQTSRAVFSHISKEFGTMGFSLRQFEEETKARAGIVECARNSLVTPYPVLYEKDGASVAHVMFTVLVTPNGPLKITGVPWAQELVVSEKRAVAPEVVELLKTAVRAGGNKKKKSGSKKSAAAAAAPNE
ncbi:peptidase M24, structural domain-containing protein [Entophlyctis helioformis]|nr:peptidase M24, structural domain-containing protein [Entophlyctis helioformis]